MVCLIRTNLYPKVIGPSLRLQTRSEIIHHRLQRRCYSKDLTLQSQCYHNDYRDQGDSQIGMEIRFNKLQHM
ncbi:hypothetical protein DPMN_058182 [Dreissena polymorpha]|uniref:Uncharacterized protein n=1 Tax=Dreissena polymorpha TaxID=45954 RepID=A0A9D4C1J9_DREPO|nr:hypothetical protein DPMN_058182 [Dreissena polymorpha]